MQPSEVPGLTTGLRAPWWWWVGCAALVAAQMLLIRSMGWDPDHSEIKSLMVGVLFGQLILARAAGWSATSRDGAAIAVVAVFLVSLGLVIAGLFADHGDTYDWFTQREYWGISAFLNAVICGPIALGVSFFTRKLNS